jgi:hypothetical protein
MTDLEALVQASQATYRPRRAYQAKRARSSPLRAFIIGFGVILVGFFVLLALVPRQKPLPMPKVGQSLAEIQALYGSRVKEIRQWEASQLDGTSSAFARVEVRTDDPSKPILYVNLKDGQVMSWREWK